MNRKPTFTKAATHYLEHYGEPEAAVVQSPFSPQSNVLVIPAYQESLSDIELVFEHLTNTLIVVVINSPIYRESQTSAMLHDIHQKWLVKKSNDAQSWFQIPSGNNESNGNIAIVIDRCNVPLEAKHGVGKARKIGADVALRLMLNGDIVSRWIHSTDADAVLPRRYFSSLKPSVDDAFALYPFRHDSTNDPAAAQYEFSLLWYALGLQFAGSRYAFPSVGSCIAFCALRYVQVRGFPSRAAGEDFYLLNKLRKLGGYHYNRDSIIKLSSRRSSRVPFGTGPGLRKIDSLPNPSKTQHYSPEVFKALRDFLEQLNQCQYVDNVTEHFSCELQSRYVAETQLIPLLERQKNQKPEVFNRFLHDWFDGFRTLKFVHMAREVAFPSKNYTEVWNSDVLPLPCPGLESTQLEAGNATIWQLLLDPPN